MILLQGHPVTLTFKVGTQIMRVHNVHIATYACTNFHAPSFNSFLSYQRIQIFSGQTDGLTDRRTDRRTEGKPIVPSGVPPVGD